MAYVFDNGHGRVSGSEGIADSAARLANAVVQEDYYDRTHGGVSFSRQDNREALKKWFGANAGQANRVIDFLRGEMVDGQTISTPMPHIALLVSAYALTLLPADQHAPSRFAIAYQIANNVAGDDQWGHMRGRALQMIDNAWNDRLHQGDLAVRPDFDAWPRSLPAQPGIMG